MEALPFLGVVGQPVISPVHYDDILPAFEHDPARSIEFPWSSSTFSERPEMFSCLVINLDHDLFLVDDDDILLDIHHHASDGRKHVIFIVRAIPDAEILD